MKNITEKLIGLFKSGYCTPQIARIAKHIKEPSTTIHYNIKKLESEGAIKAYKAVFDYKKINQGTCNYVFINLGQDHYGDPEQIAYQLAKYDEVESIDICTGEFELIIKLRTKDIDEYYEFVKKIIKKYGFRRTESVTSLKQVKTEFVIL
ncbi:hypothetical protein C0585_03695 [Candidatus Woesearchaeota archaeon]|nr:MAG: hypothetical protein C0585_03695 [Candidatus Woesearchaeota archaeon]